MDNCSIHKATVLDDLYECLHIFFLPPYSPFLNPIEEIFGTWKFFYRKRLLEADYSLMERIIFSAN